VAAITSTMAGLRDGLAEMDFLHEISSRMTAADSLHLVLDSGLYHKRDCVRLLLYVRTGRRQLDVARVEEPSR
jgi:hypothetical protein